MKVQICKIAKEWNVSAQDLLEVLNELGVPVRNHLAWIDDHEAEAARVALLEGLGRKRNSQAVSAERSSTRAFEEMDYEATFKNFQQGDIVKGYVIKVAPDEVLVDVGGRHEGVIPIRELSSTHVGDPREFVHEGDELELYILREENEDGQLTLSKKRVDQARGWLQAVKDYEEDKIVMAPVKDVVKGGLIVDIYKLRGFVPASQLRIQGPHEELIGQELPLQIMEVDQRRNKLILSHRLALGARPSSNVQGNGGAPFQVRAILPSNLDDDFSIDMYSEEDFLEDDDDDAWSPSVTRVTPRASRVGQVSLATLDRILPDGRVIAQVRGGSSVELEGFIGSADHTWRAGMTLLLRVQAEDLVTGAATFTHVFRATP